MVRRTGRSWWDVGIVCHCSHGSHVACLGFMPRRPRNSQNLMVVKGCDVSLVIKWSMCSEFQWHDAVFEILSSGDVANTSPSNYPSRRGPGITIEVGHSPYSSSIIRDSSTTEFLSPEANEQCLAELPRT